MAEWLKAHDSKSCGQQCLGGSNPLASARKIKKRPLGLVFLLSIFTFCYDGKIYVLLRSAMSSIFSKIIAGEIPSYKIYEDDKVLAFLDINPEVKGHTLVVPKVEVDKIYDLSEEDWVALWAAVKKISAHMEEITGRRTLYKVIGTDVPHAHVHLMPYDETWEHGKTLSLTEDEFNAIREKLAM